MCTIVFVNGLYIYLFEYKVTLLCSYDLFKIKLYMNHRTIFKVIMINKNPKLKITSYINFVQTCSVLPSINQEH